MVLLSSGKNIEASFWKYHLFFDDEIKSTTQQEFVYELVICI